MISPTLMDKLQQLRLPAFRDGLREQQFNPQYAELSFEERLLLLVDMECARRLDHRKTYRIKLANFPMHASIEDLDFSADRGLDRRLILELSQCNWIDKVLNMIISGATGTGKFSWLVPLAPLPAEWGILSVIFIRPGSYSILNLPARMARTSISYDPSLNRTCSFLMIGCATRFS